mgnify:CR=1 FL=1
MLLSFSPDMRKKSPTSFTNREKAYLFEENPSFHQLLYINTKKWNVTLVKLETENLFLCLSIFKRIFSLGFIYSLFTWKMVFFFFQERRKARLRIRVIFGRIQSYFFQTEILTFYIKRKKLRVNLFM